MDLEFGIYQLHVDFDHKFVIKMLGSYGLLFSNSGYICQYCHKKMVKKWSPLHALGLTTLDKTIFVRLRGVKTKADTPLGAGEINRELGLAALRWLLPH